MTDRFLYTTVITAQSLSRVSNDEQKRVSVDASINTDYGDVAETGSNPGTTPIRGAYIGQYSELIARELVELAQATNYAQVPYYTDDSNPLDDKYVTVDRFSRDKPDPTTDNLNTFNGQVTTVGSQQSHFRAVKTQPAAIDNPFDGAGTNLIAIPTTATKVRWYDEKGQQTEDATVQSTLNGRFNDHDTYSPDEPTFDDPTLIFKLDMSDEGDIDARVWDDFDRAQDDGNGVNTWQKAYITGHVFDGAAVVENGLCRFTADEDANTLTFEEWNDGTSQYDSVALAATGDAPNWQLDAINFTRISPTRVEGQTRWRDTVNDADHTLDFQVNRASNRVLFITPTNEGTIPTGLSTKLSPIAEDWSDDSQSVQKIIPRTEVNN